VGRSIAAANSTDGSSDDRADSLTASVPGKELVDLASHDTGSDVGPGEAPLVGETAQGTGDRSGKETGLHVMPLIAGLSLVLLCLVVYVNSNPSRTNIYTHFVLQAQAWMDGQTSIPMPQYQDVMPVTDASGNETGRGIIPFPPLPALVLMPFVSLWHEATNEQLLAAIFGAIDVGIAYWMLGFLPINRGIRWFTTLFLGLGTVLWYASAIGSTWFWAHIVAVGCLLGAVGLALSADASAAGPRPLAEELAAARRQRWPGGWQSAAAVVVLGGLGALLFLLARVGTDAALETAVGVAASIAAAFLALAVAGRRDALIPILIVVLVVGGVPALLILGSASSTALAFVDLIAVGALVGLGMLAQSRAQEVDRAIAAFTDAMSRPETRQIAAGLLFGLAITARLTIVFGFPFLILVGGGGSWLRRGLLAGAGTAVPILALLVYTYAATGDLFNPAYNYQYVKELGYISYGLPYHPNLSIEDLGYVPQNLAIMLFSLPHYLPQWKSVFPVGGDQLCTATEVRGLFDTSCPLALPDSQGMSIILTSPAYLLAPVAFVRARFGQLDRAAVGAAIAIVAIALVNLMHFSQGWVQFGYRFSNDFVPFALILVALGASRLGRYWAFFLVPLVALSIAVNFWGTTLAVMLGW
jgi:hypothetical protein